MILISQKHRVVHLIDFWRAGKARKLELAIAIEQLGYIPYKFKEIFKNENS